jgi:hypothetical protein
MHDTQYYKGGSPVRPGNVVLERRAPNEIGLAFEGFFRISASPAALSSMLWAPIASHRSITLHAVSEEL